jgi:hypothetical protein
LPPFGFDDRKAATVSFPFIAALLGIAFYYLYPPESGQRQACQAKIATQDLRR